MSRFNRNAPGSTPTAVNLAGGQAHQESPELELVSILLTSFVKDQFYRSADDTVARLRALIAALPDKRFAAKAALYARKEFGMRSITHVVAGELAKIVKGETWTKHFYNQIVHRPDDASEIMAYYGHAYGTPFPNSLKKGLALALARFTPYEIAKYRGEGKDVSLVDIVNITHPKHTDAIGALVKGDLKSTETWESKLTAAGQNAENDEEKEDMKNAAWRELLLENKLGYFALLRNLRNILTQAPDMVDEACKQLVDADRIRRSLVLPFRFTKAMETVGSLDRRIQDALSRAMEISLANVPPFTGSSLVVVDTSGSMMGQPIDIASLFAAAIYKANPGADLMQFSDHAAYMTPNGNDSLSTLAEGIKRQAHGGGTNFNSIFETANKRYDRVFILSDMQGWVGYHTPKAAFDAYKRRHGADPSIYSFDLAGHGTLQFPENKVFAFAGFSEKVFDIVRMFEEDKNALISRINQVEL